MKRRRSAIVIILLSLTATSCWTYKPQLADIPLIDHKGDVRLAGSIYWFPPIGANATVSMGLTNHLAMQFHGDFEGRDVFYSHAALGFYNSDSTSVLEGYLGLGHGHGDVYIDANPASAYGPYTIGFAQFNYGWHLNRHWDIGLAMKVGRVSAILRGHDGEDPNDDKEVFGPRKSALLEPQFFVRVGGEKVKFQLQLGYTYLPDWPRTGAIRYIPISLSTGLNFTL